MFGVPPNCRPECIINQDCPSNRACIRNKCEDPCVGACGFNAQCTSFDHKPVCNCMERFEGDPYSGCNPERGKFELISRSLYSNRRIRSILYRVIFTFLLHDKF